MSTRQKIENRAYEPEFWEEVPCPFCGSSHFSSLEKFGNKLQYAHVYCLQCKLVYLNPRPVYDDTFVYDAYEFYAVDDERYCIDEAFYSRKTAFEKKELESILEYDRHKSALLDVGCAVGKFLYHAQKHYAFCMGLDVSENMAGIVKQHLNTEVAVAKFEEWESERKFSCIHMSHVLEHFPHPGLWLDKAASLLLPDGILVISVPHMFSADRILKRFYKKMGLMKNTWEAWRTPDHLFEPGIPAMRLLLEKHGFDIIDFYTYSRKKIDVNSLAGRIYHRKLKLGSNLKFIVKQQKH